MDILQAASGLAIGPSQVTKCEALALPGRGFVFSKDTILAATGRDDQGIGVWLRGAKAEA